MQGPVEAQEALEQIQSRVLPACSAARLPLGNAAGKVPLSSSLLAHSSQAPATAPPAIPHFCRAKHTGQHTTSHNTSEQGQQHTQTPPLCAPFQGRMHCKRRWVDVEFSLQHGASRSERCQKKQLEEAGNPHSLHPCNRGHQETQIHKSTKVQFQHFPELDLVHAHFRPGS